VLAAAALLVGAFVPISTDPAPGAFGQVAMCGRAALVAVLAIVVLLGPGLVLRSRARKRRAPPEAPTSLGFTALPGLGLLTTTGGIAWATARSGHSPRIVSTVFLGVVLAGVFAGLAGRRLEDVVDDDERTALIVVSLFVMMAVSKSL